MIEQLADDLYEAWRSVATVPPPVERVPELTVSDAYAIQQRVIAARERAGARRVGRKVGLTSAAMQEMLGVDEPDFGVLLDEMVVTGEVDATRLIAPRIEPEIAFTLGARLEGDVTVDEVLAATRTVRGALEIIDSRVEGWRITIVDTVADNASSALVVLGDVELAPKEVDFLAERATMRVGDEEVSGTGDAVLGHPAAAVAWLARALAEHGERLEAGDVVLPGSMARALPFASSDTVRCGFTTLGTLEVKVR